VGAVGAAPAPTAPPPVTVGSGAAGLGVVTAVPPGDSESPTAVTPAAGGAGPTFTIGAGAAGAVAVGATAAVVAGALVGGAMLAGAVPDGAVDGLKLSADGVPAPEMFVLLPGVGAVLLT